MKVTFLGQAGLLFEHNGKKVMIDPYFSDSVGKVNPQKHRRVPVDDRFAQIKPDVLIFTHNHLDHYDPETVQRIVTPETNITVLAPTSVWNEVRKIGGENNYVLFDRYFQWSQDGIRFSAVKAAHSDAYAIGVILNDGEKTYYVTGDTLYSTEIFGDLSKTIDVVFLPVNGVGNNMNMEDAARFARDIGAKIAVPVHTGLFDDLNAGDFSFENKVIPEIFREICLK